MLWEKPLHHSKSDEEAFENVLHGIDLIRQCQERAVSMMFTVTVHGLLVPICFKTVIPITCLPSPALSSERGGLEDSLDLGFRILDC